MVNMETIYLKPNTIKDRGLPDIISAHRRLNNLEPILSRYSEVVYRGPYPIAMDNIVWFLYGEKYIDVVGD